MTGEITKDGINSLSYVPIDGDNIDSLSVKDNLILVDKNINNVKRVLKEVGLEKAIKKKVSSLSFGESQRLSVARALLTNCDLYLFDEITANLDPANTDLIFSLIKKLSLSHPAIITTHVETIVGLILKK